MKRAVWGFWGPFTLAIACASIDNGGNIRFDTESEMTPNSDADADSAEEFESDTTGNPSSDDTGIETYGSEDTTSDTDTTLDTHSGSEPDTETILPTDPDTTDMNTDSRTDASTDTDWVADTAGEMEGASDTETESMNRTDKISTIIIDEDSPGFCFVEGVIGSSYKGYSGIGYADTKNKVGAGIEWSVDSAGGNGELDWTFATSGDAHRLARVLINGIEAVSTVDFTNSELGSLWTHVGVEVILNVGHNSIRLESTSQAGLADIDFLTVKGPEVSAGSCDLDVDADTDIDTDTDADVDTDTDADTDSDTESEMETNTDSDSATDSDDRPDTSIIDALVIQESDNGFCSVDGSIESEHKGYTGIGYANTQNKMGTGIEWSINAFGETVAMEWSYALGTTESRSAWLLINDVEVSADLVFISTGSWDAWNTVNVSDIHLGDGINTIRLESTSSEGLPNVDYLKIFGADILSNPC